jgi:dethiobiotin synthetase
MGRRLVVVGTGTEVGKTHVAVALAALLRARGETVAALKPVETGVLPGSRGADASRLAEASEFHVKHPCYEFEPPVSPHLAARQCGRTVELKTISEWVRDHDRPWQIVETAGGLLSPLSETVTNLDLVLSLEPWRMILVASNRLGVLHDVAVCCALLRDRHPQLEKRTHIALSAPAVPDGSTASNAAELAAVGISDRVVGFPREASFHDASAAAAARLLEAMPVS